MGKLNRFFATSTTLAEGSFWRRCLPTPPSLPRFASCPPCAAGGRGQERCPRSTGGTRGAGLCATGGWRWMPGKRQRGERAGIQQGLEKRCQLCQTMPKNPTGKASAHAQRGDARWKAAPPPGKPPKGDAWGRTARSCGSAPAQGTLHMPRGDVRAGMLQRQSQSGKGRRSRRKGLRGAELARCESTAGRAHRAALGQPPLSTPSPAAGQG